jgi:ribosomal protein S18 acetylase RimI-like enzyme
VLTVSAHTIRIATLGDLDRIKTIAVAAGMFSAEEAEFFTDLLGGFLDGSMPGSQWLVLQHPNETVLAAAYYAPEPFSDRMWNLYFIAVDPAFQAQGLGSALMAHVETELRHKGEDEARVLIVETSSTEQYVKTREFYRKIGYDEEARVRQFYGPDDHKVMFWKSLVS